MNSKILINLILAGLLLAMLSGCNPSSDNGSDTGPNNSSEALQVTDVNEENAGDVVVAFFQREGFFSGSYFHNALVTAERAVILQSRDEEQGPIPPLPEDYVRSESLTGPNSIVRMSVDGDGNILPSRDWRNENSNYCLEKGKYMRTPMWQLQVEFHPETKEVFIRLLDIETAEIEKAGRGEGDDDGWVDEAITEAWNQSTIPEVERADSPCGDDIELTLVFESEVTVTADSDLSESSVVESRIPLGPGSEPGVFVGASLLLTTDYEGGLGVPPNTSCSWVPVNGEMSAEVTLPNGSFDPDSYSGNLYYDIDVSIRVRKSQAPGVSNTCTMSTSEGTAQTTLEGLPWYPWFHILNHTQQARYRYFYPGVWDSMEGEPFGLAERVIDRTETYTEEGDTLTLDEVTTLTIRTEKMSPL